MVKRGWEGDLPVCGEMNAVLSKRGKEAILVGAAEQIVLSLVKARLHISLLLADCYPFL